MTRNFKNTGIYVASGSVKSEQISVGRGATSMKIEIVGTNISQAQAEKLSFELGNLVSAIDRHKDELNAPEKLKTSVTKLAEEVSTSEPSLSRMQKILNEL